MKKLILALVAMALVVLIAAPAASARSDMGGMVAASNVEIVRKDSVKGSKAPGGKGTGQAATGVLGASCTGQRYAIVVGISNYPGTSSDLNYSDDDAIDVYDALISQYGFQPEGSGYTHVLVDLEASFDAIKAAVDDIKSKATSADEVVFFFSGHGAKGKAADGDREAIDESLVVHNGDENGVFRYIWDGQLKEWFSGFQTSRIVFIFDSCLSGGMIDLSGPGRILCMASTETGYSYEDPDWNNGQFTYYFVEKGIVAGLADKYDQVPAKADVTVEEAFDYAKANCQGQTAVIDDRFVNDLLP